MTELKAGMKLGEFTIVMKVNTSKKYSPSIRKRWRVQCSCGKRETIPESYLLRKGNPKTHCGCKIPKTNKTLYNQEYRIWCMMRQRCYNPKHVAYKDYGGRGIKMHFDWIDMNNGFDLFLKEIGPRPSPKHSVDRKDVNGNYTYGNVKWATAKEQAYNTRAAIAKREAAKETSKGA